jgi:2-polyprenyl-3-methyl-5-hydroxy-6-metoxy-1,4-benzoquinol methylase
MKAHNKASAWFNKMYQENRENQEKIPWARQAVNPLLQSYLDEKKEHNGTALVIGCGLGDDAYALALAGYKVTAIDVSESALTQAQERFPQSSIIFKKQDIFEYKERFDFVFEAFTIQSLPIEFREKMIEAVACRIAKGGALLVVAHKEEHKFQGPPYPLVQDDIDQFKEYGLQEKSFEIHTEPSKISNSRFRVLYHSI